MELRGIELQREDCAGHRNVTDQDGEGKKDKERPGKDRRRSLW